MTERAIRPETVQRIRQLMERAGIRDPDVEETFVRGSGAGGQKINKTSSCVFLSYPTAGIEVKCQRSRSLALNRHYARWELCERIAEIREGEISRRQMEAEKVRRQKRRRSRRQRAKMLDDKHRHAVKKSRRKPPATD